MNFYDISVTAPDGSEVAMKDFEGKGYGDFKKAVGTVVVDALTPVREEFNRLLKDKKYLEECYKKGAETATYISNKTLSKVKKKVGLIV